MSFGLRWKKGGKTEREAGHGEAENLFGECLEGGRPPLLGEGQVVGLRPRFVNSEKVTSGLSAGWKVSKSTGSPHLGRGQSPLSPWANEAAV